MAQAQWDSFKIKLPGKDFLEPIRDVMETLLVFLEVLKAILETVKIFLLNFPNPIAALVEALIRLVTTFFEAINRTGIYAWYDVPEPTKDPHFFRYQGGYQAFIQRFKGSLLDTRDPYRPQPISGATQSGFIAIVADAQGPVELIRLISILLKFFSKDTLHPKYPAPANLKILPVGDKGEPILNLARVFEIETKAVVLSWTLPGSVNSPDPGFNDIGATIGREFVPPNWVIERNTVPLNEKIKSFDLNKPGASGIVMHDVVTDHEKGGAPLARTTQTIRLVDNSGDPITRFEKVTTVESALGGNKPKGPAAIMGALGVFKWIDTDVELDHTYYYRVRAYSGDLPVSDEGIIQYGNPVKDENTKRWYIPTPGGVVWGLPSGIHRVRVPKIPPKFNVIKNLEKLFMVAFSLNFHLEVPFQVKFDDMDDPIGDLSNLGTLSKALIGRGSLVNHSGIAATIAANPIAGKKLKGIGPTTNQYSQEKNEASLLTKPPPWGEWGVQYQSKKLASVCGSALLEQGSGAIGQFQAIMESYPRGKPKTLKKLTDAHNLSQMCAALTYIVDEQSALGGFAATGHLTDDETYQTYGEAFNDPLVRKNTLFAIRFITSYLLGGTPPDWIQVSVLRDIIPWSGQLLYEILAKIQALLDAFKSVMDEIAAFIDMLERKIDALERFIEYLISILDFILSLEAGFYVLRLPSTGGDVFSWMSAIDSATGTPPTSGPGGYSAGVAFAYIAPDITAFVTALDLIF
jgi:hypothetical protein